MLDELFLVEGIEMLWKGLRYDGLHSRLARVWTVCKFERFVLLLVRCLELEFLRLVVRHSQLRD